MRIWDMPNWIITGSCVPVWRDRVLSGKGGSVSGGDYEAVL